MRNLVLSLTAIVMLGGPAAAQTADWRFGPAARPSPPDRCTPATMLAEGRKQRPPSMKLGDQPPASHFYAVYNVVDGCPKPIVLRKGIGGDMRQPAPVLRAPPRAANAAH